MYDITITFFSKTKKLQKHDSCIDYAFFYFPNVDIIIYGKYMH